MVAAGSMRKMALAFKYFKAIVANKLLILFFPCFLFVVVFLILNILFN
jgi:hypothetical protein